MKENNKQLSSVTKNEELAEQKIADNLTEKKQEITLVDRNLQLDCAIPEEERAIDSPESCGELEKVRQLGYFSSRQGMENIENLVDGKLFACIYEDEKGMRFVEYCQRYEAGGFSPKMRIPQADIRVAALFGFGTIPILEKKVKNKVENFLVSTRFEYAGKFKGTQTDELDIITVLEALYKAMPFLLIYAENEAPEIEAEQFYWRVVNCARGLSIQVGNRNKSYFILDDDGINYVAHEMGMRPIELLKKLKKLKFLYLTPSSRGYQTNVRVKGPNGDSFTEWLYCVYNLEYFATQIKLLD